MYLMQYTNTFLSYDTIGAHLMRKRGVDNETSSFTTVQYDTSESGDPRIVSWMEDLQTTTNTLESRLTSLEHSHKNAKDSNELARCVDLKVYLPSLYSSGCRMTDIRMSFMFSKNLHPHC